MADIIGKHYENDVLVTWRHDSADNRIIIEKQQDIEAVLDNVSAANANGITTHDGVGRPVIEMPLVLAMEWCAQRGIPWEKFMYSNEYDDEWKRFAAEHSKLKYEAKAKHIGVSR
jgi:hypothetical protein